MRKDEQVKVQDEEGRFRRVRFMHSRKACVGMEDDREETT